MERKISNKIISIHDGFIESGELIKKISPNAYLNSVLLDLNKNISVEKIKYLYYEKLLNSKSYKSFVVEIDNLKLKASYSGEGYFPQKQIDELSQFDPVTFPLGKLDINKVKVDIEQLIAIALNEPPYFIPSELENIFNIDASLFVLEENILWRFLCEHSKTGFRTLHIDAESGTIVLNKLDKIIK
jgi:hypothetical protein